MSHTPGSAPKAPRKIQLHRKSRQLELSFEDQTFLLDAEYLRVYSPSAEVRGHGDVGGELPSGKQDVAITHVVPAGNYALHLVLDRKSTRLNSSHVAISY